MRLSLFPRAFSAIAGVFVLLLPLSAQSSGPGAYAIRWICVSDPSLFSIHVSVFCTDPVPVTVLYRMRGGIGADQQTTDTTARTDHLVVLSGLHPSTTYEYCVIAGDTSAWYTFHTAVGSNDALTFAVYGDTRSNHDIHAAILNKMSTEHPRVALHTGDLVSSSTEKNFDSYFHDLCDASDFGECVPIYSAIGNHEGNPEMYLRLFDLPHNNPDSSSAYYSFDYGCAHFICLDTEIPYDTESPQYRWLKEDLAGSSDARYRFVFLHRPPYSSSIHGSTASIRTYLCPMFERAKIDVVFAGHDHDYERTKPVNGVTYIVTGGGGAPLYKFDGSNSFTACKESVHHFLIVKLDTSHCSMRMIRLDGTVGDSLTIDHSTRE